MKTRIVDLDGGRTLNMADYPGETECVISLHGLTGNCLQLRHYCEALSPRYHVIAPDLRGRGDSGCGSSPSSLWEHQKDIVDLISTLRLHDVILMGYSMGAFISALVASQIEVKGLILLDGAGEMSEHQNEIVEPTFSRLSAHFSSLEEYVETVVGRYGKMGIPDSEKLRETVAYEVKKVGDHWENKGSEAVIREDWSSFWRFHIEDIGSRIHCPSLLVEASGTVGTLGPLFFPDSYVKTKNALGDLTVRCSDASHYTMVFEKRDDIQTFLEEYLREHQL